MDGTVGSVSKYTLIGHNRTPCGWNNGLNNEGNKGSDGKLETGVVVTWI